MSSTRKSATAFAFGITMFSFVQATTDIYMFDRYEPAWGPHTSFQVALGIILVAAIIGAAGFGLGLTKFKILVHALTAAIAGTFLSIVFSAFVGITGALGLDLIVRTIVVVVFLFGGGFAMSLPMRRFALPPPEPTNNPPDAGESSV